MKQVLSAQESAVTWDPTESHQDIIAEGVVDTPANVEYHEMEEYSTSYSHLNQRAYTLYLGGQVFLRLYLTLETCTLAWNGAIDFSQLDNKVFYTLPHTLHGPGNGNIQPPPDWLRGNLRHLIEAAKVSFIVDSEIHTYTLFYPHRYRKYQEMLKERANDISFARYDVRNRALRPWRGFEYTLTASNPSIAGLEGSEVTLMMPKKQRWSSNLFGWIMKHHMLFQAASDSERKQYLSQMREEAGSFRSLVMQLCNK